jgi:hypothetical protein
VSYLLSDRVPSRHASEYRLFGGRENRRYRPKNSLGGGKGPSSECCSQEEEKEEEEEEEEEEELEEELEEEEKEIVGADEELGNGEDN